MDTSTSALGETKRAANAETHNPRSKGGRVRDLAPLHQQQLTLNPLSSTLNIARLGRDDVERADTLAVQAGVLGVRLAHEQRHLLLDKVAHRPGVVVQVARSETLCRKKGRVSVALRQRDWDVASPGRRSQRRRSDP